MCFNSNQIKTCAVSVLAHCNGFFPFITVPFHDLDLMMSSKPRISNHGMNLSDFVLFPSVSTSWRDMGFSKFRFGRGFSNFEWSLFELWTFEKITWTSATLAHNVTGSERKMTNLISTSLTSQSFPVRVIEIYLYTLISLRLDLMSSHTIFAHLRCVPLQVFINGSYLHIRFLTPLDLSHSFSFSHDYISLCIRYPPPLYIFATGFAIIYAAALPWRLLSFPIDALSVYSPLVQHLSHSCS